MATTDYVPIAADPGANVVDQASWLALLAPTGALKAGFIAGVAPSAQVNKALRQSSMMSAAVASFISNALGINVPDDGVLATLITNLTAAIQSSGWSTGDVKLSMKTVADPGWIMVNDGTIGSGASGATYANANAQALFLLLWGNVSDAFAPVVGGRGGSAAADWAANKKITLTKMLGRALAISGAGAGLTARALGENLGEEGHVQTTAEVAPHTHDIQYFSPGTAPGGQTGFMNDQVNAVSKTTTSTPAAAAANVMQPTSFLNAMIKL